MDVKPSKLVPALIGGSAIALLSTIPIINFGNCLCCMWIILGGFLAANLHSKDFKAGTFTTGDGALVGFLAGIFGALIASFLTYFFMAVLKFNPATQILDRLSELRGDLAPEFEDMMDNFGAEEGFNPLLAMGGLFFGLIINGVFATIGGLIGASVIRKKTPPAPVKTVSLPKESRPHKTAAKPVRKKTTKPAAKKTKTARKKAK